MDAYPSPRTATSFSMSSSSEALTSICALSSPEANFSARPWMYSALRCESPAVRSVAISFATTWAGEGNAGWVSSNSAVNFLRMDAAAAPETWVLSMHAHDFVLPVDCRQDRAKRPPFSDTVAGRRWTVKALWLALGYGCTPAM